jgi:anti-anti-sigma factor
MRSEALDITIKSRGSALWLELSGPFHNEQVPNIRDKITGLINDGNKQIVVDMESVTSVSDGVAPMFLGLLNTMKGKHGDLRLVFKNSTVSMAFAAYRNVFSIHPNSEALAFSGLINAIRRRGILLSRRTGVRLSRPVAIFLLAILVGWLLTLALVIQVQNRRIRQQEKELNELSQWKQKTTIEVELLRERLKPMEQLGLLRDAPPDKPRAPLPPKKPAAAAKPAAPAADSTTPTPESSAPPDSG